MKTIYKKALLLTGSLVLFSSCTDDYFDTKPDNLLSTEKIFTNRYQTEGWWGSLFASIPDTWNQPYNFTYGYMTDEMDASNWVTHPLNSGAVSGAATPTKAPIYYERIRLCNIFLENVDKNTDIQNSANGTEKVKVYKAEARFLRAYYHWLIMREVGPMVPAPLKAGAADDNYLHPRKRWDDCVNFVLEELDAVEADLPLDFYLENTVTIDNTKVGRINKLVAQAFKSQVLLFHASPLYNGNAEFSDFKNPDGTVLLNPQYDESRWKTAADAAKGVIELAHSQGKKLFTSSDPDPFKAAFLSVRDLFFDGWKEEGIWLRPSSTTGQWENHIGPRSLQVTGYNGISVVQELVDEFGMEDGSAIKESSLYSEDRYAAEDAAFYVKGTNSMYHHRESRFYAFISFNGAKNPGPSKAGFNNSRVEYFNTGTSGKAGAPRDWPRTGYVARKNLHPSHYLHHTIARPAMVIRLAELYLNYAEALNEYQPGHPDIAEYLNRIRQRAGLPAYQGSFSKDEMRKLIHHERRIELCFEGQRFFDVRRWKLADQPGYYQGGNYTGMDMDAGTELSSPEFHTRKIALVRAKWQRKFYFMPYHQSETNRNPQLVQFPGY